MHARIENICQEVELGEGPENLLVISVSLRGPCGPPSRSDWNRGVQLLLEGTRTSFSKEPYSNMFFPGDGVLMIFRALDPLV